MNIDFNSIIIDDIPGKNRKTQEPTPLYLLACWVDEMIEQGTPATGAQVVYKLTELAGGERVDVPYQATIERNISRRLNPQSFRNTPQ